jgi:hypothetical protein
MGVGCTFLIIQEHVNVFNTVLQNPATPLDLVEEQLTLKAACHQQSRPAITRRNSVIDEQFTLNLRLDGGL